MFFYEAGFLGEEWEMTLDELAIGQSAVVTAVGGEGALRRRLLDMGITPKTTVLMRKNELTLRLEDARKIEITGVKA